MQLLQWGVGAVSASVGWREGPPGAGVNPVAPSHTFKAWAGGGGRRGRGTGKAAGRGTRGHAAP